MTKPDEETLDRDGAVLKILIFVAVYFLLVRWLLPRLGVPT